MNNKTFNTDTTVKDYLFLESIRPNMSEIVKNEKVTGLHLNTEAFSFKVFLNQVTNFFKEKFHAITSMFKVNSAKKDEIKTLGLVGGTKNLKNELTSVGKAVTLIIATNDEDSAKLNNALKGIVIPAIPGISPKFDVFVNGLVEQAKIVDVSVEPTLETLDTYISRIVNDGEFRTSVIPDKASVDKISTAGNTINNFLTKNINGKILADTRKFNEQYDGIKSLPTIQSKLFELSDLKSLDRIEEIFKKCEIIANKTNKLYEMINKGQVDISKPRLDELCKVLQDGAQFTTDAIAIIRLIDVSIRIHTTVCYKLAVLI